MSSIVVAGDIFGTITISDPVSDRFLDLIKNSK